MNKFGCPTIIHKGAFDNDELWISPERLEEYLDEYFESIEEEDNYEEKT